MKEVVLRDGFYFLKDFLRRKVKEEFAIFKPSKLPASADFHLFKDGIEPKWEDPECANGGKWALTSKGKGNLHTAWLEILMALIGEQFGDSEDICGVVVSVRQWQDKFSLWTKTAANESV
ncbi:Eukaryotic initiation factor 4E protein [Trifolium repens]|nr:Eukaryotic initiation factor 4E protein [Trifolium repens]KAK2351455.1 Eukaryotic initiation factor 4E protein [Trifolium repens]